MIVLWPAIINHQAGIRHESSQLPNDIRHLNTFVTGSSSKEFLQLADQGDCYACSIDFSCRGDAGCCCNLVYSIAGDRYGHVGLGALERGAFLVTTCILSGSDPDIK